jgi:RsiW-degrading membrane proteinase PrsW (M82 family)
MTSFDPGLLLLAAAAATAWTAAGAARLTGARVAAVARGLLGGGAAFGLAVSGYGLLQIAGLQVRWEQVMGGGWTALGAAMVIGLVEEGAKLGGLALAVREPGRPAAVMATTVGTCAAFAALETVAVLSGGPVRVAVARALLAPVAHAVLSVPLGFGVALAARRGLRAGLVAVPVTLALSAVLHAAGNLALSAPRYGRLGYATALLAPVVALFLHLRRLEAAPVPVPLSLRRDGEGSERRA